MVTRGIPGSGESSVEYVAGQLCMYWLHFALRQDSVWPGTAAPSPRSRRWRKHSRLDYESDRQTISLKRSKASSSSDENASFIAPYSPASSEEEVCVHIFHCMV